MQCTRPIAAYRAPGGGVAFSSREGYVDRPFEVPCGQCIACRINRANSWALRCVHEAQLHERSCFVTLTYDAEHVPRDLSLSTRDLQLFWKRLRKRGEKFRYFACGEYGERTLRPHYHALLFGVDFSEDRVLHSTRSGSRIYVSKVLEETWGKGFAPVGSVTFESARYVAQYCLKKYTGAGAEEEYSRTDKESGEVFSVKPPFVVMSRRPGLGAGWLEKYRGDVYPRDEVIHEGRSYRPPRFYDERLAEDELEELKGRRLHKIAGRSDESTPERLRVKERVQERRIERYERKL